MKIKFEASMWIDNARYDFEPSEPRFDVVHRGRGGHELDRIRQVPHSLVAQVIRSVDWMFEAGDTIAIEDMNEVE